MRLRLVVLFVFVFFALLLSRIYYLSIKSNVYYEELAKQNAVKTQFIAPTRGLIFDRNNELLASNNLGFSIMLKPYLYIKKNNRKILDDEIVAITQFFPDLNASMLKKNYVKEDSYYNQDYIAVVDFIPYDNMISHFSELSLRENLQIQPTVKRFYPFNEVASHIIGYIGRANLNDVAENELSKLTGYVGKSGVERYYNEILQGTKGIREVRVNALNKEIEELENIPASSKDLSLSIDMRLQNFLSELFKDNAGAVIIMDANNGEIIAAGSFPEYDLNPFVTGISTEEWKNLSNNPDHPFTNKMVNGLYPPGSLVKMGVGLAFLNSRTINTATTFFCSGVVELGGRLFRCWNRSGHGAIDLKHAIKYSCDAYFYQGGFKVGIDIIAKTLNNIGFGSKTGVDLPSEFIGTVPSREWKMQKYNQQWYQGETLNTSIGQGNFLVTPMQVAKYTAQIATGREVRPHFIRNIEGNLSLDLENLDESLKENLKQALNDKNENLKADLNLNENLEKNLKDLNLSKNLNQNLNEKLNEGLKKDLNKNLSSKKELFSPFEKTQLPAIREAMLAVTKEAGGTAYRYFKDLPLSVAGKTGTAQVVGFSQAEKKNIREKDLQYYSRSHTWFSGFAPFKEPKIVVTVLLEHGGRNTTSGNISVAIFQKLIELGYLEKEE